MKIFNYIFTFFAPLLIGSNFIINDESKYANVYEERRDAVFGIKSIESSYDSFIVTYDSYSLTGNEEWSTKLEITNLTTNGPSVSHDVENGKNILLTVDSKSFPEIELNPEDEIIVTLYTVGYFEDSYTTNINLTSLEDPFIAINDYNVGVDFIQINYTYEVGKPENNEEGYVYVENITQNQIKEIPLLPGVNKTLTLNIQTVPTVDFNLNDRFIIILGTKNAEGNDIEKNIIVTLKGISPVVKINSFKSNTNSIQLTYSYTRGSPNGNEKAIVEVRNKTTGESGEYNKEVKAGVNTIKLNDSTVDNVSFNPGNAFEITIKTKDSETKDESTSINLVLEQIIKPTIGLEINYDDAYKPSSLNLELYYIIQGNSENINASVVLYDSNNTIIESFENVRINQKVFIDLTNKKVDAISVKYDNIVDGKKYETNTPLEKTNITGNVFAQPLNSGIAWWVWLLIGLAIAFSVIIVGVVLLYYFYYDKNKKNEKKDDNNQKTWYDEVYEELSSNDM